MGGLIIQLCTGESAARRNFVHIVNNACYAHSGVFRIIDPRVRYSVLIAADCERAHVFGLDLFSIDEEFRALAAGILAGYAEALEREGVRAKSKPVMERSCFPIVIRRHEIHSRLRFNAEYGCGVGG